MSVFLSYMWRFWRRKSALLGLVFVGVFLLVCITSYSNQQQQHVKSLPSYYHRDHHAGEGLFLSAGSKKLQQSSNNLPEDEGVKFLPAKLKKGVAAAEFGIKKKYYNEVDFETRQKVAAKHRQVIKTSYNEKLDTGRKEISVFDMDGGDYQRPPEFLNAPVYRGDHGPDNEDENAEQKPLYIPKQRLVHIDLKGAPPKLDFLVRFLKLIKDWGATGILIEYEDTFPFDGMLKEVAAGNHYSKSDIYSILIRCKELGLEVIPLLQTFGHMEFILKLGQFAHLRDSPEMPESICPCHEQTMSLLQIYIDQIMSLHKGVKQIHIGCDEVYHLGECSGCSGRTRSDIFTKHVASVASYVKQAYPHIENVIIWDDMLRNLMGAELVPLRDLVVPMVWVYAEEIYRFMPNYNWDKLSDIFPTAWTASAYKGADGPTASVPNVQKRINNNLNWLDVMSNEESKMKNGFSGIVVTGWSRYDHFAVLAELLPAALPSLATSLLTTKYGYFNASWQSELFKSLECADNSRMYEDFINLEVDPSLQEKMSWCFFPGSQIFKMIHNLGTVQTEVQTYLRKYSSQEGWMTDYNFRHNFSSPFRVNEGLDEQNRLTYMVNALIKQAHTALAEIYDQEVLSEWIEQKIYPLYKDLNDFKLKAQSLKMRSTWPKRPLPALSAVKQLLTSTTSLPTTQPPIRVPPKDNSFSYDPTVRPKRLVQAPDYYRHPPGSF